MSLLAPVAAFALVGCGSGDDGTIPEQNGNELLDVLEKLQTDVNGGSCDTVPQLAEQLQVQVRALPAEVDPEVKAALLDAAANLRDLSQDPPDCADSGATGEAGVQPASEEDEEPTTEAPVEAAPEEETEEGQPAPTAEAGTDAATQAPAGGGGGSTGTGGGSTESGGITGEFQE